MLALGVGPVGAAFYAWDVGMKRGDIRVIGAASYATPLLSTGFLILVGFAEATATLALAALLDRGRRPDRGEGHHWLRRSGDEAIAIPNATSAHGRLQMR